MPNRRHDAVHGLRALRTGLCPLRGPTRQRAGSAGFRQPCSWLLLALFFWLAGVQAVPLMEAEKTATCSVLFENDLFGTTDLYYTNGVKLSCLSRDVAEYVEVNDYAAWLNRSVGRIPYLRRLDGGSQRKLLNVGVSLGQKIFTPADISRSDLVTEDRPYAGWLYFGTSLHARNNRQMDTAELQVGVVGPWALGEKAQNEVHRLRDIPKARGWDHQLGNELGIVLVLEHRERIRRHSLAPGLAWDAIGHYGGALGNVYTYLNAGGEIRIGRGLPEDFGTALIRPGGDVNGPSYGDARLSGGLAIFGFAALSGRYVLRNIFLDGNTFSESHSVDKRSWVGDALLGMGLTCSRYKLTFSRVFRSREFEGQPHTHSFGSVNLSVSF